MARMLHLMVSRTLALPGAAARGLIMRGQAAIEERGRERLKARLDWRDPAPTRNLRKARRR
ncbi:hypothetical protein [Rhodovulum euryhalinum]|uniref:Uncharacterized protein n=1 Tax=Rhodovulum euryhalinum TaxID=35805 RepID=A0A4R2KMG9_9RHOB|nr:hypothetical protein [Rhodovulum euryhalinum]TCO71248.1 hypothetical protein EV655_107141 [Rhodovulum euryhalinum]